LSLSAFPRPDTTTPRHAAVSVLPRRTLPAWRAAGHRAPQGDIPRLACSARLHPLPCPAFPRLGGSAGSETAATAGGYAAGDEKALHGLGASRTIGRTRGGTGARAPQRLRLRPSWCLWSTPRRHPLRHCGWRRLRWAPFLFPLEMQRRWSWREREHDPR